jgi:hypothetical protein
MALVAWYAGGFAGDFSSRLKRIEQDVPAVSETERRDMTAINESMQRMAADTRRQSEKIDQLMFLLNGGNTQYDGGHRKQ